MTGRPRSSSASTAAGRAHLITYPPEDGRWEAGDVVTYRCADCLDRWDLVLEAEDLDD